MTSILLELAKQYNVQMPSDQLFIKGAAFALRAGGRSPRVAKQFVELLAAGIKSIKFLHPAGANIVRPYIA